VPSSRLADTSGRPGPVPVWTQDYEVPDSATVATESKGERRPPGRHTLKLLVAPIIFLIVISNVGDALAPKLVEDNPLLLIAMNSRNRNLILVTNQLDALSYYGVATLRLLLSDPLFFLIGYWYGDTAIRWMEQRTKSFGGMLREWEKWFTKAAYPLVFIAPNNIVCLLAGGAGMRVSTFFTLNVTGTFARLYLIRWLGDAFERPIDDVLDFIARYRTPLLVVSITFFMIMMVRELRQGREDMEALEDAIDDDA
jgi:membrane protein DedA with SNARE-associated domain